MISPPRARRLHDAKSMSPSLIARTSILLCAAASLATIGLLCYEGEPHVPSWWPIALAFMGWTIAPYAALSAMAAAVHQKVAPSCIILFTTIVAIASAAVGYVDAFFIHIDPQSALVVLPLPLLQWVAIVVGGIVAATMRHFRAEGRTLHRRAVGSSGWKA